MKKKVAFICVHNSCRSQMAEAIGNHLYGDKLECYSAGTKLICGLRLCHHRQPRKCVNSWTNPGNLFIDYKKLMKFYYGARAYLALLFIIKTNWSSYK